MFVRWVRLKTMVSSRVVEAFFGTIISNSLNTHFVTITVDIFLNKNRKYGAVQYSMQDFSCQNLARLGQTNHLHQSSRDHNR
jgi:hypothetical protein